MDMPTLPPKVRLTIYISVTMGTAFIVPLDQLSMIPDWVSVVWSSVAGAASLLAAFNISKK